MSETEAKKYNPEDVKSLDVRKKEAADIVARQKEIGYDKKTPEGKLKLSQEWIKKAKLSPKMIEEICFELGVSDLNNPKTVEIAVKYWQENNGLGGKNADGIMGWATLEKLDAVITEKYNSNDTNNNGTKPPASRLKSIGEEEDHQNSVNRNRKITERIISYIEENVNKLRNGESYEYLDGSVYKRVDYADNSTVITKTSLDGEITYKDGTNYISEKEYAKRYPESQWNKNRVQKQVNKLGNGESFTDENGDIYKRVDYTDNSTVITKTSPNGEIMYKDRDQYVHTETYAKTHEKSLWYRKEMNQLMEEQKTNLMVQLKTPEGNLLYTNINNNGEMEFMREISGQREFWNQENGWENRAKILAEEKERKRLDGLAVSTDPQDYYSVNSEPAENPYELAEIAKSKLPKIINIFGMTSTANDLNLERGETNERGVSEIQNGTFFTFEGKGFQVTGLERYANGTFRIHVNPINGGPLVYSAQYLSDNAQKIEQYENKYNILASLNRATGGES